MVALSVVTSSVASTAASAQCQYQFIPAPDPGAFIAFVATSIGDDGIVGGLINTLPDVPAYWEPGVGLFALPTPPQSTGFGRVRDVLNRDAMVGGMDTSVPIFWRNGQMEILPTPDRVSGAMASGINRHLQIVGDAAGTSMDGLQTIDIPVLWDNGQYIELPMPEGAIGARPAQINDHGLIAGWAQFSSNRRDTKVVIWRNMQPEILGAIPGGEFIAVNGLNNAGTIVGTDFDPIANGNRAFMWRDGAFVLLPTPAGLFDRAVRDISDAGQIVGSATNRMTGGARALLWQHGQVYELGSLDIDGFIHSESIAINNDGVIVVLGGILVPVDSPPGDVNTDCRVNVSDLLLLLGEWGNDGSFADVNMDGVVNHWDLIDLLINWG